MHCGMHKVKMISNIRVECNYMRSLGKSHNNFAKCSSKTGSFEKSLEVEFE